MWDSGGAGSPRGWTLGGLTHQGVGLSEGAQLSHGVYGGLTHQGVGLDDLVLGVVGVDLRADVVLAAAGQSHQLQAVGGAGELLAVADAVQEDLEKNTPIRC